MMKPKIDPEREACAAELRHQEQRVCVENVVAALQGSPEQMAWWFKLVGLIAGVIDGACEKSHVPKSDWPDVAQATLERLQRNNFRSLQQYLNKRYLSNGRQSCGRLGPAGAANDGFAAIDISCVTRVRPVESWIRGACKYEIKTYFANQSKGAGRDIEYVDRGEGIDCLVDDVGAEAEASVVRACTEEVKAQAVRWARKELERRDKTQLIALEMYWEAEEKSSAGRRHVDKRQVYRGIDERFCLGGADKAKDFVRVARQRLARLAKAYVEMIRERYRNDENYRGPNLFFVDLAIADPEKGP